MYKIKVCIKIFFRFQGDSGGPLIWRRHDGNYLMGIISFGIDCGATDKPGVFTRVTEYITWIDENIKLLDMSEAISTVQPCIPVEITLTIDVRAWLKKILHPGQKKKKKLRA